ncbi:MAG: hypothetical protein H6718_18510 [Polyangiaceae bacterium]|nr:hypothetical protein [Myxococcales bacterium]MCB9587400.1 hypothetical protein [Polyangiaceae bacterium]MCB9605803.1 hypothetical protein [Polyangiaceae bacterium]
MLAIVDSVWSSGLALARAEPGYVLSALLAAVILLLLLKQWWVRVWRRLVILGRQRRAYNLERGAHGFLEAEGYFIEAVQARTHYRLLVDGDAEDIELRVDFIVRKHGQRFAADVKTGNDAPRVRNPATRRQLLEYQLAYEVDGVLLVDMEARAVRCVQFPED